MSDSANQPNNGKGSVSEQLGLLIKLLTFVSTSAIAVVGYQLKLQTESREGRQYALDTLIKVTTLTTSGDLSAQRAGLLLIDKLDDDDFLLAFSPGFATDPHFKKVVTKLRDQIYAQRVSATQVQQPQKEDTGAAPTKAPATEDGHGWVYIGEYNPAARKWNTKYLDPISDQDTPNSLVGRDNLKVSSLTGDLNVRTGPATETYIAPVSRVLSTGEHVEIVKVVPSGRAPQYWGLLK